jgi:hypothetical protein
MAEGWSGALARVQHKWISVSKGSTALDEFDVARCPDIDWCPFGQDAKNRASLIRRDYQDRRF